MDVQFTSHKDEVLTEFQKKTKLALDLIGEAAERHAKADCPRKTGRLRNSIAHQTVDNSAYIGTNVEYGLWVEIRDVEHENGKAHFLRDAASQHNDEYKGIAKMTLQE